MKAYWWKLMFIAILLAGCVPDGSTPAQPVDTASAPTAVASPAPARETEIQPEIQPGRPDTGPGGISYEENLRINPPAVRNLAAQATGEGILLTWEAPPEVTVSHSYSDEIFGYKIYRRAEGEPLTGRSLLAETQELRYLDTSAAPGVMYSYTVTALHDHNVESTRPDEVSARR